jgi:hypothetical protein
MQPVVIGQLPTTPMSLCGTNPSDTFVSNMSDLATGYDVGRDIILTGSSDQQLAVATQAATINGGLSSGPGPDEGCPSLQEHGGTGLQPPVVDDRSPNLNGPIQNSQG